MARRDPRVRSQPRSPPPCAEPRGKVTTALPSGSTSELGTAVTTFTVKPSPPPHTLEEREAALADLKFGNAFTDHMARATWEVDKGWSNCRVEAYAPLLLDP